MGRVGRVGPKGSTSGQGVQPNSKELLKKGLIRGGILLIIAFAVLVGLGTMGIGPLAILAVCAFVPGAVIALPLVGTVLKFAAGIVVLLIVITILKVNSGKILSFFSRYIKA